MKLFIALPLSILNPILKAEVYDWFTFFNELDLLKV